MRYDWLEGSVKYFASIRFNIRNKSMCACSANLAFGKFADHFTFGIILKTYPNKITEEYLVFNVNIVTFDLIYSKKTTNIYLTNSPQPSSNTYRNS